MRVLLLTLYFAPDVAANAVVMTELAEELAALGHRVTVVSAFPHYAGNVIDLRYRGRFIQQDMHKGIRVNVTAMMSAQQCFLAALAGATYVSIFGGRVNNMGYNVCSEFTKLRKVLDQFGLRSQIIVGSTREVLNIIEWLEAGAHIVTVVPDLLKGMIVHPYSKETVQQFLRDAARAEQMLKEAK